MHAAFVKESLLINAIKAAETLGLSCLIAVTCEPGSTIDKKYIDSLLARHNIEPEGKIYETVVNSTGRASQASEDLVASDRAQHESVYRGACHSVLQNIQVNHEGKVLPCCGVLPALDSMVIGKISQSGDLQKAINNAYNDDLLKWISLEGPIRVACEAAKISGEQLYPSDFDGNCTACNMLFQSGALLSTAKTLATQRSHILNGHTSLLESLGLFIPPKIE